MSRDVARKRNPRNDGSGAGSAGLLLRFLECAGRVILFKVASPAQVGRLKY